MKALLTLITLVILAGCQSLPQRSTDTARLAHPGVPNAKDTATPETDSPPQSHQADPAKRPAPPKDLIDLLARNFSLPYEAEKIENYERFFLRHPKHLPRTFARARPFLPHIVQQLQARDMPLDIALLPVVESAFNPYAHSWQGAAGLWQFTESTARHEGLKINWWYDGRRDPLASTGAALNYLQKLYNMTGDWLLALAAYNGGIGNVLKAMRKYRQRHPGQNPDFWAIQKYLPKETRHYVPQLLAVANILRHGKQALPQLPLKPEYTVVVFDKQIALPAARKLAGVEAETFFHLNAGYKRNATPPEGPHYLLLPQSAAAKVAQAWQTQPQQLAVQIKRYTIRPGDSLILIAKRFGVPVADLRRLNRLRTDHIIAGRTLLVPDAGLSQTQLAALNQRSKRPRWTPHRHRVKKGESFWTIAQRYGLSVRHLAQYNGLSVRKPLRAGMMLKIPKKPMRLTKAHATGKAVTHIVRKGDSLWVVAKRYGVSTDRLKRWNRLSDNSILRPGQKLIIHLSDTTPRQRRS
ncbi:MAG TPA: LysM peptidoglycan-binding domain-containing protein [Sulfurivirga caldicuralii]|nr:LysM peptidoglycan-binding domain-containing protein [Sulfurivirga caldicuralii]